MINRSQRYYHYRTLITRLLIRKAQGDDSEHIISKLKQYRGEHLEAYRDVIGSKPFKMGS